jgi:hypothetical protein
VPNVFNRYFFRVHNRIIAGNWILGSSKFSIDVHPVLSQADSGPGVLVFPAAAGAWDDFAAAFVPPEG